MKKFEINLTTQFKKDLKKFINYPSDYDDIVNCIELLKQGGHEEIPAEMLPHRLQGKFKSYWECHVHPNLLLIW
ncbi:MAG: type II toxin-antitoxin system YafQ family toxin [Flavobacteriaceae bacterium]|jgi:mRNA interferase YafQ|nr:type II toxin-antitoxin system YafQ family toxin [Flavobacteriaceae bacterium]